MVCAALVDASFGNGLQPKLQLSLPGHSDLELASPFMRNALWLLQLPVDYDGSTLSITKLASYPILGGNSCSLNECFFLGTVFPSYTALAHHPYPVHLNILFLILLSVSQYLVLFQQALYE